MKIVLSLDSFYPVIEGPVIVLNNMAALLNKKKNVDVQVFVPTHGKETDAEVLQKYNFNYPIHFVSGFKEIISKYIYATPGLDKELINYLDHEEYDIVHIHSPFNMSKVLVKHAKKRHIPTVMSFHTKFKDEVMRYTHSRFLTKIVMSVIMSNFNRADYVFTVSEGAKQTLQEYGYSKPIYVVRNGTDMFCPANIDERIAKINELHNLEGQENVFLFVGRLVKTKNLVLAFNALKLLKDEGYSFKLLLVGFGEEQKYYEEAAKKLGILDNLIFTGRISDRDLLMSYYIRADLFLFPSVFDTASLAPIEAATFGLPTLLVKDSPTSEIIIDEQNGYTAEEDPVSWKNKLISIINNKEHHQQVRKNAKNQVYRTWQDVADEFLKIYQNIIDKKENILENIN